MNNAELMKLRRIKENQNIRTFCETYPDQEDYLIGNEVYEEQELLKHCNPASKHPDVWFVTGLFTTLLIAVTVFIIYLKGSFTS